MSLLGLLEQGKTHCYSGLSGWEEPSFALGSGAGRMRCGLWPPGRTEPAGRIARVGEPGDWVAGCAVAVAAGFLRANKARVTIIY